MSPPPVTAEELLRHRTWVRGLARTLVRDEASLDDLEQEAWVAAIESPPRDGDAGRSWLARVVRNRATDLFRAGRRRDAREAAAARDESVPSAAETVARAEAHRLVVDAVMALDGEQRDAVLLRYFEDLPPREVARRVGVPVETVRTRIKRGLATLRARLAPDERDGRDRYGALLLLAAEGGGAGAPLGRGTSGTGAGTTAAKAAAGAGIVGMAVKWLVAACVLAAVAGGAIWMQGGGAPGAPGDPGKHAAETATDVAGAPAPRDAAPRARRPGSAEPAAPTAAPAAPASAAKRSVRLVHEDGRVAAGARVVVCDAAAVHHRGSTDADGRFEVAPSAAERALLVQVDGDAARRVALPAGTDPCDVLLPAGLAIGGTVIADDGAPPQPFTITLAANGTLLATMGLAPDSHEVVESGGPDVYSVEIRVAADGSFRLGGLAAGTTGEIMPPDGWCAPDGLPEVTAGDAGVVVRLHALPAFTGRVVDAEGEPVVGAAIEYSWDDGNDNSGGGARDGGEDGRFRLVLDEPEIPSITLRVTDAEGLAAAELRFEGPFDGVRDLGDVRLPDPWAAKMEILVKDPAGRPLEGAIAAIGDKSSWVSPPSGRDGRLTLPAKAAASAIVVAPGRKFTEVAVAATPKDAPAGLVLEPCAMLRVKADLGGALREGAVLVVSGASRVFDEPDGEAVYVLREPLGATHPCASQRGIGLGGESSTFRLEDADPTVVPWLVPDTDITLELRDAYGSRIATAIVKLAEGEQRETTLRAAAKAVDVVVRVRDLAGRAVAGAQVVVRAPGLVGDEATAFGRNPAGTRTTDADGAVVFAGLHGRAVAVFVGAEGQGAWFRRRIELTDEAPAIDVSLPAERVVRVRLTGAVRGHVRLAAVPADPAFWMPAYQPFPALRGDDGTYVIRGLPPGDAILRIDAGAGSADVPAPASRDLVDVEVPAVGENR